MQLEEPAKCKTLFDAGKIGVLQEEGKDCFGIHLIHLTVITSATSFLFISAHHRLSHISPCV